MGKGTAIMKVTKPLVRLTRNGMRFITKNSNVILTIVSTAGVIGTVAFAINGTVKAVKLCEEKKVTNGKEVVETVWKCYIPTIGMLILTTTAIICNGKINAKKIAVLSSAYAGSVDALKKVEEKMSEQIGPKKTQRAVDEANGEIAAENMPKDQKDIVVTGHGEKLFMFRPTGQWFRSDHHGIELAEMRIQKQLDEMKTSWGAGEWFSFGIIQEELDLPVTGIGNYMGYSTDDFVDKGGNIHLIISSSWEDLPWGRELCGIVDVDPWPVNI